MFDSAFSVIDNQNRRRLKQIETGTQQNAIAFVIGYDADGSPLVRLNGGTSEKAIGFGVRNIRVGEAVSFFRPAENGPGYVDSL